MQAILNQIFVGISIGSILLLIALGLTFTFGQMGVINMAHGEFIMAGAYTTYVLQGLVAAGMIGVAFVVALPVAFLVAGTLGVLMEMGILRRLYGRPLDTLLVTWGVSLILQQVARDVFGAPNVDVTIPSFLQGGVELAGISMPATRLFIIALVAAAAFGAWYLVSRTPHGARMRAVIQNRQLAACSGIATKKIDRRTFFLGSGLAGVAGVALTLIGPIGPTLGLNYLIDAFLVVIVGGLGQLRGAVIAAFALGILNSLAEYATQASLAKVIVFLAIVAFLQWRPQGIVQVQTRGLA